MGCSLHSVLEPTYGMGLGIHFLPPLLYRVFSLNADALSLCIRPVGVPFMNRIGERSCVNARVTDFYDVFRATQ